MSKNIPSNPPSRKKAYIIVNSDVVISAAGSTLYELCAVGTPTISYAYADNQLGNAISFDKDRCIPYGGDIRKDDAINYIISLLLNKMDVSNRKMQSKRMREKITSYGAVNIVDRICSILHKPE